MSYEGLFSSSSSNRPSPIIEVDCRPFFAKLGCKRWQWCRNVWFLKECGGMVCACFTWLLLLYAQVVVPHVLLLPQEATLDRNINLLLFQLLMFLAVSAHSRAMLTDPGTVPRNSLPSQEELQRSFPSDQIIYGCPTCNCVKHPSTHHCSVCQRCVVGMDHHCPWINNCVGSRNQKFFILFTLYICLVSLHALYLCARHGIGCLQPDNKIVGCLDFRSATLTRNYTLIYLFAEGLVFSVFTAIMFFMQICSIRRGASYIDLLKQPATVHATRRPLMTSLRDVFGEAPCLNWLNPLSTGLAHRTNLDMYHV